MATGIMFCLACCADGGDIAPAGRVVAPNIVLDPGMNPLPDSGAAGDDARRGRQGSSAAVTIAVPGNAGEDVIRPGADDTPHE